MVLFSSPQIFSSIIRNKNTLTIFVFAFCSSPKKTTLRLKLPWSCQKMPEHMPDGIPEDMSENNQTFCYYIYISGMYMIVCLFVQIKCTTVRSTQHISFQTICSTATKCKTARTKPKPSDFWLRFPQWLFTCKVQISMMQRNSKRKINWSPFSQRSIRLLPY